MLQHTEDYSNIAIAPDMSQQERTERRLLVKELRERKDKGETDLAIRKGKIVVLPKQADKEDSSDQADAGPQSGDGLD